MEYLIELADNKKSLGYTWDDVADKMNNQFGLNRTESYYRKKYNYRNGIDESKFAPDLIREQDERHEQQSILRRVSREETLKEIAHDAVLEISKGYKLNSTNLQLHRGGAEGIAVISDWHYGIEVDSYFNKYNPEIAIQRISKFRTEIINRVKEDSISKIHVINLGDLISGRIHLPLRIQTQKDIVTQTMEVAELMAQFLNDLSAVAEIEYYDTLDNHSRLEPIKENSLDLESMVRIITWFLKERLKDNKRIKFNDNVFADDIAAFEVLGHKVIAVHGDKDSPSKIVDRLSMLTKQHYDLVLSAHFHHFNCDEQNDTIRISNGSLVGTDDYAKNLRANSAPSQTFITVTKDNVVSGIYKILV